MFFMLNVIKIRIYPSEEQKNALEKAFGSARFFWNNSLAETNKLYKETGKGLSQIGFNKRLPELKKTFPFLKDVYSQVLQSVSLNLSRAFINFFEGRSKFPNFKNKFGKQSIQYPQNVKIQDDFLLVPKIGRIKAVFHREFFGILKTVTISKNQSGKYFASMLLEVEETLLEQVELPSNIEIVGIDLGIKHYAIVNNGTKTSKYDNPKTIKKYEKNLKRKQQKLSKKQKDSKSRIKAKKIVSRVHEKISNVRQDFLHKLSRKLVNENQVLVFEDLAVRNMVKNHKLAKSISDCSWSTFINFCEYKAKKKDGKVLFINRFFPSSKTCSNCLYQLPKLELSTRMWECPNCKVIHDRDENASKNIRQEGIRSIMTLGTSVTASGGKVRPKRGRKSSSEAFPIEA